jgi:hypothetical protein
MLHEQQRAQPTRGQRGSQPPLPSDESRALSYAVVMALAYTPREEFSREEIDGLCQLAYELLNTLTKTQEVF